ncbi:MAG: exodeoxyribonuclease VII small subunit [Desulfohalobiaceae bacterium]|nr:exodeoxyribonuclease VII small subunit [Desulfohalobiaceae bacterium]
MPKKNKSFEEQLARLQEIVSALEKGDLPLEEGVALFQEGSRLAKSCREQLKQAKHKVQVYSNGILEDFEPLDQEKEPGDDQTKT